MSARPHIPSTLGPGLIVVPTLPGYRFVIAGLIALLAFSGGLSFFATGPITPIIIDHYAVSHSAVGLLTGLGALIHVVLAIPVSTLVGRVGLKKLVTFGALALSAPVLSFAATDSFALLLMTRAIFSLGFLVMFPASDPLFMQWFKPRELPVVNGLFIVSFSLGIATSTFVVAPLADVIGWETALSVFGGFSLVAALFWVALGRAGTVERSREPHATRDRVVSVMRSRVALLLAMADASAVTVLTVSLAWLPTYFSDVHGISLSKAGMLMGLMSVAGVFALVLASLLSLRVASRRPLIIIPGVVIGFAAFGTFLLADTPAVYLAVIALGLATWFYMPALMTLPMELYADDPARVSVIFAFLVGTSGVAMFVSPVTVGALFDITGSFVPGLALFAIVSWGLAIAGFLLPEAGPSKPDALEPLAVTLR